MRLDSESDTSLQIIMAESNTESASDTERVSNTESESQNVPNGDHSQKGDTFDINFNESSNFKKKKKSKGKKVSFNIGFGVEEIPSNDEDNKTYSDTASDVNCVNGHSNGLHNGDSKPDDKENEIEFLKTFANLKKLSTVVQANSEKQEALERVKVEEQYARAREILKSRIKQQELAKLIPSEELERILAAVNMQEEYVIRREERKFMTSKRGKTSYIYLANGNGLCEQEEAEEVSVVTAQPEHDGSNFSETFANVGNAGGLL